jgi:riboflavin synthase
MFTGIIEETGKVIRVTPSGHSVIIAIQADLILHGLNQGDSISVDGACLTVTEIGNNWFCADVSSESLEKTIIGTYRKGIEVNLERALQFSGRLGGHLVSGHIDGKGKVISVSHMEKMSELTIGVSSNIAAYLISKGSVAINGVSLTVNRPSGDRFEVTVIPHSLSKTNIRLLKPGDEINIECDMIAKYIEKLLGLRNEHQKAEPDRLNFDFLKENGFIDTL